MAATHALVATCSRGLEPVLAAELAELGLPPAAELRGAVGFRADLAGAYRACLWSRTASRVLLRLARFPAPSADALYEGVRAVPWREHLDPEGSLAVDVVGVNAALRHSGFTARVVKDAVVDALRDRAGRRPSVDPENPDLGLHLHVDREWATLSIDLAGEPLHRRGADRAQGEAPLKETLAAALLRIAGYRGDAPLIDLFCGSGTLLVEAGMAARDIAPGLLRRRWGFHGWRGHQAAAWARVRQEAEARRAAAAARPVTLIGHDTDPDALSRARANARAFGLDLRLHRGSMQEARPPRGEPGLIVTNPPYGERLGDPEQALRLMGELGDALRQRFLGWTAWVLCGSTAQARALGLRPSRRVPVWNGPLDARFIELPISSLPPDRLGPGWRAGGEE
jgi:23S rRNA G2445 N2-methylase RlmL